MNKINNTTATLESIEPPKLIISNYNTKKRPNRPHRPKGRKSNLSRTQAIVAVSVGVGTVLLIFAIKICWKKYRFREQVSQRFLDISLQRG